MITEKIRKNIKEALVMVGGPSSINFDIEHPTDLKNGDYSTNVALKVFGPISHGAKEEKTSGKKNSFAMYQDGTKSFKDPIDLAKKLKEKLDGRVDGVESIEIAGPGFINFHLSKEFFKESVEDIIEKGSEFGRSKDSNGEKVIIEHTQPNPFKKFHIGHLMNNAIGESIARIITANGAEVKTASYHGDIGMHVAKALWKDDYALGSKAFEEDEKAKAEIQDINKKIYDKSDPEINLQYEEGRKKSLEEFEKIYKRLGTNFDFSFFESEAGKIGKKIVLENIGKVFKESEGAVVFKGEKFGLHTRVFLNSDGLPTYEAKEIGLAKIKKEKYPFDKSITITGNEQDAFFNVVEAAIGEAFPELKGKFKHLSHGMLRLPTGKMSSRTGNVIMAETLIDEVKKKVKDNEDVAIGAIKYMILRQAIGNDIVFDIEKSVSTEGDSGVYLQYAYARTNSLLEKANTQGLTLNTDSQGQTLRNTHEIERFLYRFPEVVERAGKEYAPHYITTYLTELAGSFNNFYAHEQIIENSPESPYRLAITKAFNIVMKNGLTILGIPAPERM